MATQKLTTNLWFDTQAEEAANYYTSIFKDSSIGKISHYGKEGFEIHQMPEGTVMTINFTLNGHDFLGLNGGPIFKFKNFVAFFRAVEAIFQKDIDGLNKYPQRPG